MPGGALQVMVVDTVVVVVVVAVVAVAVVAVAVVAVAVAAAEEEVAMTETGADMEEGEQSVVYSPTGTMVIYRKYNMNIVVRQWYSGELYP